MSGSGPLGVPTWGARLTGSDTMRYARDCARAKEALL